MRMVISLLALVVFANTLSAQRGPAKVRWGKESKEPRAAVLTDFVGSDDSGFYALRQGVGQGVLSKEGTIFIEKYNSKMNLVKSSAVKLVYKKKELRFEDLRLIGGELYLFTSFRNRKKKTHFLFAQTVSKTSLKPRNDLRIITQIPSRTQFNTTTFDLAFSRDSSRVLFFSQLPYQARQSERYQIKVCDEQLNELWTKDIALPYSDERFGIEECRVDREGNVYVLGIIYHDLNRKKRRGNPTYEYTLLTYTQDGSLKPEYKISLGDQFITDLTFRIQRNGDPVCAGFYSDRNTNGMRGTYFFKIDKNSGEIYGKGTKEFSFEFLTELMSDWNKRRAERAEASANENRQVELYEYDLDRLVLRSDGGAVLVAEQFYVKLVNDRVVGPNGMWQNQTTRRYHYNDIIVVNISPDGNIDWASHVPKRQVTTNDGGYFSSYAISVTNKAIYMVFNDNGRNFDSNRDPDRMFAYNGSRSVVTLAEVLPDGTVNRYPLFSNREEGIITRPKVCRQTGVNEMIIYGERNRKYKFAKVGFE